MATFPTPDAGPGMYRGEAFLLAKAPCFSDYLLHSSILGNKGNFWYPTETGQGGTTGNLASHLPKLLVSDPE